ncbi:hypothetical protein PYCC9005_004079 [Savitreella phatthalungensis]
MLENTRAEELDAFISEFQQYLQSCKRSENHSLQITTPEGALYTVTVDDDGWRAASISNAREESSTQRKVPAFATAQELLTQISQEFRQIWAGDLGKALQRLSNEQENQQRESASPVTLVNTDNYDS